MPLLTRRQLIRTGVAGGALLALAACTRSNSPRAFDDSAYPYRVLSPADRELIAAISPAMLAGALPRGAANGHALVQVVRGVDVAMASLTPYVIGELHQLFGLLEFAPARAVTAGIWSAWPAASPSEVAGFLTRWRFSGIALYRNGYQALHQLVMASWYGNASSWRAIGYPGPPPIA